MRLALAWLALEVASLDRAREFYETRLDLPIVDESDAEVGFAVGDSTLTLRRPSSTPRGGLHTHYAFGTRADAYDAWRARLESAFDVVEHQFGAYTSLYLFDPDGHCVEIGGVMEEQAGHEGGKEGTSPAPLASIFEVVLEVADLERATSFYRRLGTDLVDRGTDRRRVRLDAGGFDLELWEPQLGIAGARGGVHVDLGIRVDEPAAAVDALADRARNVERDGSRYRVRDPDGHHLTFVET